jgi:glucose-1-phosphate adenylyltransferase
MSFEKLPLGRETMAVVLAGGRGTRLAPLTRNICKPALPYAAGYRSIDFSLANCYRSKIGHIGVATQHLPQALHRHIEQVWGREDREPSIELWFADDRAPRLGYRGTADAVFRNLDLIEKSGARYVLVLAGDHVYEMDYRPMLAQHRAQGATVTIGCIEVPVDSCSEFGVMGLDRDGAVYAFVEKPQGREALPRPAEPFVTASMGIYVFDVETLTDVLTADAFSRDSRHDFGRDVLPALIRRGGASGYRFRSRGQPAYWRDVGTLAAYWQAHMELLDSDPPLHLDDPFLQAPEGQAPSRVGATTSTDQRGSIEESLTGAGCRVAGRVARSVLFQNVDVQRDAKLLESVALPGAVIEEGCRLRGVIVDSGYRVPAGTVIDTTEGGRRDIGRTKPIVLHGAAQASVVQHAVG